MADGGVVDGAGGPPGPVDRLGVERRPAAVGAAGQVGDQDVGVQLRVAGPAGAVPEPGGDEPAAGQPTGPEVARTRRGRWPGCSTRDARNRPPAPASRRRRRRRRRARRRSGRAPAGRPSAYSTDTDFGAENVRSNPGTRPFQVRNRSPLGVCPVPGFNPASTARRSSPRDRAAPARARRTALPSHRPGISPLAGVVVVEALGDLPQVVGLGADPQLPQRQHPNRTSTPAEPDWREESRPAAAACSTLVHGCELSWAPQGEGSFGHAVVMTCWPGFAGPGARGVLRRGRRVGVRGAHVGWLVGVRDFSARFGLGWGRCPVCRDPSTCGGPDATPT